MIFSSQRLDGLVEMSIPFGENVLANWEQFGSMKNFSVVYRAVVFPVKVRTWTTLTGTAEGPYI